VLAPVALSIRLPPDHRRWPAALLSLASLHGRFPFRERYSCVSEKVRETRVGRAQKLEKQANFVSSFEWCGKMPTTKWEVPSTLVPLDNSLCLLHPVLSPVGPRNFQAINLSRMQTTVAGSPCADLGTCGIFSLSPHPTANQDTTRILGSTYHSIADMENIYKSHVPVQCHGHPPLSETSLLMSLLLWERVKCRRKEGSPWTKCHISAK